MTISTIKKPLIILLAILTAVMLLLSANINVSANSVSVGSTLFTDIDNISISGTTQGLKLTSIGKEDTSTKYINKLYFGNNFSLNFDIIQNNFNSLVFTIISENEPYSDTTKNISDIETVIKLTKTESGFDIKIDNEDAVSVPATLIDTLRLGYNTDNNKFYIEKSGTNYNLDKVIELYKNEGYLKIGFEGIETSKTAEILITNINNQPFTSSVAGNVEDNTDPVMRINTDLLDFGDDYNVEAPVNISYKIPVYGLDILSSTIKYDIEVLYSQDAVFNQTDEENEENIKTYTSNEFTPNKEGYYKITKLEINDNNGNHTTECEDVDFDTEEIIVHATFWDTDIPTFTDINGYINSFTETYYIGGKSNKLIFKTPAVTVNCFDNENDKLIGYKLYYKTISASTFSVQDGLVFTANSIGSYVFQIQAIDRTGNYSQKSPEITLHFEDVTSPEINITGFVTEHYIDQSITLPSSSITDDMDGSPDKTIAVYYIKDKDGVDVFETDEDGEFILDDQNQKKKILITDEYTFTPEKLGWYQVIYTAEDDSGNRVTSSPMTFEVIEVEVPEEEEPFIDFSNKWNIVFLSIAALSAIGLIVLMFIKPKEEK